MKEEINHREPLENYSQWLMGVALQKNEGNDDGKVSYAVRMVTKTNQSSYVDGMDIELTEQDGQVEIDPLCYENSPDLMGSPIQDSIKWMLKLNKEIIYLEQLDPHREELYLERLKYIIGEYSFETLDEYDLDNKKINLIDLYQDLLQETLLRKVSIEGKELRPGEYELSIVSNHRPYTLRPKSNFTKEDIVAEIREKIILPLIDAKDDDENDNYEKYREIVNKTSSR